MAKIDYSKTQRCTPVKSAQKTPCGEEILQIGKNCQKLGARDYTTCLI